MEANTVIIHKAFLTLLAEANQCSIIYVVSNHGSLVKCARYPSRSDVASSSYKETVPIWFADSSKVSLVDKWKAFYKEQKRGGQNTNVALYYIRALLVFQAPTQLYVFLCYIIPYLFQEYDEWSRYYLKVLVCYLCVEGLANYLCCVFYKSFYVISEDRPSLTNLSERWKNPPEVFTSFHTSSSNGHVHIPIDDEDYENNFCKVCQHTMPPRVFHCKTCKMCILKRDHHCYMVGTCIGFSNQRYFVVLVFYAFIIGTLGSFMTYRYLKHVFVPYSYYWTDFVLPITMYRVIFGSIPFHIGIMIFHMYTETLFGFIGFIYFTGQIFIICSGKTLYEVTKKIPVKSFSSINSNFVSVFGNFWLLNFLFPMQIIFRQTTDGTSWDDVKIGKQVHKKAKIIRNV
ncbi:hypothetical protein FSP39_005559 [Pinctada imbricata]|uniref:Palmitoyltransferase n=1 Tax=Pinctada imbricata TaxID=66713 RepID=A0AA88Y7S1_PINIB|nr:hypothetical protein FSP39_005559 [Pinctada imbricata]